MAHQAIVNGWIELHGAECSIRIHARKRNVSEHTGNRARMRGGGHVDHPHAKRIATNTLRGVRSVSKISELLNVLLRLIFCLSV